MYSSLKCVGIFEKIRETYTLFCHCNFLVFYMYTHFCYVRTWTKIAIMDCLNNSWVTLKSVTNTLLKNWNPHKHTYQTHHAPHFHYNYSDSTCYFIHLTEYFPQCLYLRPHSVLVFHPTGSPPVIVFIPSFFSSYLAWTYHRFSFLCHYIIVLHRGTDVFWCRRHGSAKPLLLGWKMNPPHHYPLHSYASLLHGRPAGSLSLHPRGVLQRPLLSPCSSHSFHFPRLCLPVLWRSLTPVPFSGFLPSSLWLLQRYTD